jgi:hypothetical protein
MIIIVPDIVIVIGFLSFHAFFITLVRQYSLNVYLNFSKEILYIDNLIQKYKNMDLPKEVSIEEIIKKRARIKEFVNWEGIFSFFGSSFWIYATIVGILYLAMKLDEAINFQKGLATCTILYLLLIIYVFQKRDENFRIFSRLKIYRIILLFYIIPSLIYPLIYKSHLKIIYVKTDELTSVFYIWLLSILFFIFWFMLWANYAPYSKLTELKEILRIVDK